jgi:pseudouridine synthase, RluA family
MQKITSDKDKIRIDNYLIEILNFSRNKVQKMIKDNTILVNDNEVKNSYQVKIDDEITILPYVEEETKIEPENIKIDIVYEDDDVIVVNKPNKMVVHPAVGNKSGTLVNALLYHFKNLSDLNGDVRPGIVHRIDAETTGLLMIAKNNKTHEILAKELEEKKTYRKYVALVHGVIKHDTGTIDAPIGRDRNDRKKMSVTEKNSKDAITHFKVLERYENASLIELNLETGRTHQIRVHLNYIEHPVVNDKVYGRRKRIDETGQCLHAKEIGFTHPKTKEFLKFDSELPECFMNILNIYKEK